MHFDIFEPKKRIKRQNKNKFVSPSPNTDRKKVTGCHVVLGVSSVKQQTIGTVGTEPDMHEKFGPDGERSGLLETHVRIQGEIRCCDIDIWK